MPILSVITINLNNCKGLKKTIESIVSQAFNNFEFLIVDGASSDESKEVINQYNNRIDWWVSEKDTGIYNAMNKGIHKAKGKYCLFLNSGDWLSDNNILSQVFTQPQDADIISGDIAFYDSTINAVKWLVPSPEVLTAKTLFNGTLPHQATFIKRELFEKYGYYNENIRIVSDWQFFLETLLEHNVTYHHHKGLVSYFNMDGISFCKETQSLPMKEKQAILELKYPRFIADFELLKQMEEHDQLWKESKEFKVYCFYKKYGIIGLGVLLIRGYIFIKRKLFKSKKSLEYYYIHKKYFQYPV